MPIDPLLPPAQFHDRLRALGIEPDAGDDDRWGRFLAMLLESNKAFNLTAITEPEAAWLKHILDSLTLLPLLAAVEPAKEGGMVRVIDIGSGGGLPGIPLAIAMPDVRFTLVDATGKKAKFLKDVAKELELRNVNVLQDRAERMGQDTAHREKYDAAMARAVGALPVLAEFILPLVRKGGVALAIKGAKAEDELRDAKKAIAILGGEHEQTVETPTGRVVVLTKARPTPWLYPRRDGEPASKPLGTGEA